MRDRRGVDLTITGVILFLLGIIVLITLVALWGKGSAGFNNVMSCHPASPGTDVCIQSGGACPTGYDRAYYKIWGCPSATGSREACCVQSEAASVASSPVPRARMQAYRLDIRPVAGGGLEIKDRTPLREGDVIPVVADFPLDLMIEAQVEDCGMCEITREFRVSTAPRNPTSATFTFKIENEAGIGVLPRVADRIIVNKDLKTIPVTNPPSPVDLSAGPDILVLNINNNMNPATNELRGTDPFDSFMVDRSFRLKFGSQDVGETLTLTGKIRIEYEHVSTTGTSPTVSAKEVLEQDVVLRFQVKSGVRYGSLTQKWEQSKRLFAMCEDPVVCDEIYYLVIDPNPATLVGPPVPSHLLACPDIAPLLASSPAKKIESVTRYYVVDETGRRIVPTAFPDLNACVTAGMGSISDPDYAVAYNLFMQHVGSNTIPAEVGVLFRNNLNKMSRVSCQADVDPAEGIGKPLLANQPDPAVKRWEFTLDKPYMQDLYLCVYGKSSSGATTTAAGTTSPVYYSAAKPAQIKIDRTAPVAGIDTDSFGTHLTFTCEDSGSGCEDYRQIAYISDFEGYLGALFSGQAQSATLWCPDYKTSRGYSLVRGQEMAYFDPVVRAMCMRVVDKAGNAGVTLAVVGWPMFLTDLTVRKVLEKYASEPGRRP